MTTPERLAAALADRYKIERELGAGGMATVYLAADLKHDRRVAIKVLKPELAAVLGAERFVVEIKTTAALQHPHILPLFDSGTADGFLFYVMPYIEGETIREKLNRESQFGIDEALRITREVADALDYAHRHGVIHRDIKPENILLHDGRAMVMDFGIALAVSAAAGGRMTETGLSLGTPHYMSPEQATAEKEITPRSDVYSLASVLYEMLAGQPPHVGGSAQQIIMKIITEQVQPVTNLRKSAPPHVGEVLNKALEKLPADRFENAKAFGDALTNPAYVGTNTTRFSLAPQRSRHVMPALVAMLALALAVSLFTRPQKTTAAVTRISLALPESRPMVAATYGQIALSPDGKIFVYTGVIDNKQMLMLRRRDDLAVEPIAGTEGATQPFFSPDGKSLAFFASGQIKKVALTGGPPIKVADAANPRGGTWTDNGYIVFSPSSTGGLLRVAENGGTPVPFAVVDSASRARGSISYRWPAAIPGGAVVFTVWSNVLADTRIGVVGKDGGAAKEIISGGNGATHPKYTATGHLLFANAEATLVGVKFDVARLDTVGPLVTLMGGVAVDGTSAAAQYAIADDGTLCYIQGSYVRAIMRVNRDGTEQLLQDSLVAPSALRFSPDGSRLTMETQAGGQIRIWVYDLARRVSTPLTFEGVARYPSWHPTENRVLFAWRKEGTNGLDLYDIAADGSGAVRAVYSGPEEQYESHWLHDLRHVIMRQTATKSGSRDVMIVTAGTDSVRPFVASTYDERAIALSRDGRWLAYVSEASSQTEVYVRAVDGRAGQWQISRGGGGEPAWSADGKELFYRDAQDLISVSVETGTTFAIRDSRKVFRDVKYVRSSDRTQYDVHPSGQWFVMSRSLATQSDLVFVFNWFEELKQKMR